MLRPSVALLQMITKVIICLGVDFPFGCVFLGKSTVQFKTMLPLSLQFLNPLVMQIITWL